MQSNSIRRLIHSSGPETVDRAMIGTTRRINEDLKTIDWIKGLTHQKKGAGQTPTENIIYRVYPEREGKKLVFQIGSSDPDLAVEAARLVAADVAGIDVNAGCPKPFSTSGGMGAALLRTPDKLCAILEALVKNIVPEFDIGISVKIRILETAAATEELVRKLCKTGITGLTVHCRTTPMRPRERAIRGQLRMVADICREHGVACLMNGDVTSKEEGLKLAEEFGADGAMIAVAAEKNPSCFRSEGGLVPWQESVEEYLKICMETNNRWANTKYLLTQMIPGKSDGKYQAVTQAKCYEDIMKILGHDHLIEASQKTDVRLGLNTPERKGQPNSQQKRKLDSSMNSTGAQKKQKQSQQRSPASKHEPLSTSKPEVEPEAVASAS